MEIKKGNTIIDIWGNKRKIINDDCGTNISGKLYEYEEGKYICEGNIREVIED